MNRSSFNVGVDIAALVLFVFLASTGLLITFQLPPGSGGGGVVERPLALTGNVGRSFGRMGSQQPINTIWGLSRHEWGDVHFWIAMAMLGVIAMHLYLHWKWILAKLKPLGHSKFSRRRVIVSVIALVILLAVALAPHFAEILETPRATASQGHTTRVELPAYEGRLLSPTYVNRSFTGAIRE